MQIQEKKMVIVGGGLVGSLLAIMLKQKGHEVCIFEKRSDLRQEGAASGRSINLVVTSRGLRALELVGLKQQILDITTPVFGRMIHNQKGQQEYQSYSKDNSECNYSISRGQLNQELLTYAEQEGVPLYFEHELQSIDIENNILDFGHSKVRANQIFGTDGGGSVVRKVLVEQNHIQEHIVFMEQCYKELLIPAGKEDSYLIEKNALHIWPRGKHMLMALPNLDGSFTVTLYLDRKGETSFSKLNTPQQVQDYFQTYYPDAVELLPDLEKDFFSNPTGSLGTVKSSPWFYQDHIALVGDAAHAVVPFFGQGMNAGFEDCSLLFELFEQYPNDFEKIFSNYSKLQKPNGDAIADMAVNNYIEMSEYVGDSYFLLKKKVEALLGRTFPKKYLSKYSMVTHSLIPYQVAQEAGLIQNQILEELCKNISDPKQVDLAQAEQLIEQQLSPLLAKNKITL